MNIINRFNKYRPKFSITEIGRAHFYGGIIFGICSSLLFYFVFYYFSIIGKFKMTISYNPIFYDLSNYSLSNSFWLFIGTLSSSFGLCFTLFLWMSKRSSLRVLQRKKSFARAQSTFFVFIILMFLMRGVNIVVGLELELFEKFPLIAFLLPLFLFLQSWNSMKSIYVVNRLFYGVLLFFLCLGFVIGVL